MKTTGATAVLLAATLSVLHAAAADRDDPPALSGSTHEAPPDMPYVPGPGLPSTPRRMATQGVFTSVQANIDANGDNIVGDAANEPSIAVNPLAPNQMAVGWRQFDSIESSFRQAGYAWSVDGGRTWSGQQIIEPGIFRSDPVLGAGPTGTFYYLSLSISPQFACDMFVSTDGGQTWPTKSFAFGGDKAWFAVDPGDVAANFFQACNIAGNPWAPAQFNRSLIDGESWEEPVPYDPLGNPPARPSFGILDVDIEGAVYVAGAQNSGQTDTFWVAKSANAGDGLIPTFEQITSVDFGGFLVLGAGPNPSGLTGQVEIKVDKSGGPTFGNVYVLASIDPPGPDPMDIHLVRSEDGGATFSDPIRVNDDAKDNGAWQWFGTMGLAPSGRIDVVWNDTRDSGETNINRLYYASSTDGGETWTPNIALSPPFDSWVGWPQQNKLGDYYHMVSDDVGAHLIWAATFNGEQDVYYLRIGDYDCNSNGIGDEADIASGEADDCNDNGIPDSCEIAAGAVEDENGDGIPDECGVFGDLNGDGIVDGADLGLLLGAWGECPGCPEDLNGDGIVDGADLGLLLGAWTV